MYVVTPRDAKVYLDFALQRDLAGDVKYGGNCPPAVYLTRLCNLLLTPFGKDAIIAGLDVTVTPSGSGVNAAVTSGVAIVDSTVLLLDAAELSFTGLASQDPDGFLVLVVNFSFRNTVASNAAVYRLLYVSANGNTIVPGGVWSTNQDRLLLGVYKFEVSGGNISRVYPIFGTVTIRNTAYRIRPRSPLLERHFTSLASRCESFTVSAADVNRGYLTLAQVPLHPKMVSVFVHDGIELINRAVVAGYTTEKGDFAVLENKLIIRNGTYVSNQNPDLSVTFSDLTDEIAVGDILTVEYMF